MNKILWLLREIQRYFLQFIDALMRGNESSLAEYFRRKRYKTSCLIDTHVFVKSRNNFQAGQATALYHGCYILNTNGTFKLGNNSHLGAFCYVNVCYGSVSMGDNVVIGPGTKVIAYSNHYAKGKKVTDEHLAGKIIIGNNIFIGANCSILPGTFIEDNVIVGAGAVIKGRLEANSVYAGVPCRKVKTGWYE